MKRNYLYYLLVVMLLVASCEKDEMACTTSVETQEVSSIAATTAKCGGIISSDGNPTIKEAGVEWCTTSDFESNVSCASTAKAKLGKFACEITNLKANTQYYVRAYARNSYGTIYGKVLSFKTLEIVLPAVQTNSVTNITISSATVGGKVTSDGGASVTERGVVYSTSQNPTTSNTKKVSGSGTGSFSVSLSGLTEGTTYYVRAYAINSNGTAYGSQVSFATKNGYAYVDLGLSVKWATCNVGASSPEDYGDYFAWGETTAKTTYDWSTYKWCNGSFSTLTKYCNSSSYGNNGFTDYKTVLDLSDDAARANWGGSWRMPTDAELAELRQQCTWTWTTQNGVNGYKVTSKKFGYTNKSIFLPAAGHRYGSSLFSAGSDGDYWSSSRDTYDPCYAYGLSFNSDYVMRLDDTRNTGQSVRPVCP